MLRASTGPLQPRQSANLDFEELVRGVVAKGLGVHYVASVKSFKVLPVATT
jgi:hypothetical protein